jgi:hypothetical protein
MRLDRKAPDGKKILPLNDVGCVSYLNVGWITGTMWKAFRVSGGGHSAMKGKS